MPPKLHDGQSIGDWLNTDHGDLLPLSRRVAEMSRSLRHWCDAPWVKQLRVANVRADVIVVFSASAAALVPLRARQSELLGYLNARFGTCCRRIETKVRPPAGDQ